MRTATLVNGYAAMKHSKHSKHGRRGHKRNDSLAVSSSGESLGKRVLKFSAIVLAGAAVSALGMIALSYTSLSSGVQDGIIAGIAVVAGGALFAMKQVGLGLAIASGMGAIALSRTVIRMNVGSAASSLLSSISPSTASATPSASAALPAPGGFVVGTPYYQPSGFVVGTPGY